MTHQQIKETCTRYLEFLNILGGFEPKQNDNDSVHSIPHIMWMLKQIPDLIDNGKIEKAHRWLGFVQGVLWKENIYSIEDMKNHNR